MPGLGTRLVAFVAVIAVVANGCLTIAGAPETERPTTPGVAPSPSSTAVQPTSTSQPTPTPTSQPTPTVDPASIAGPPFPRPEPGVMLIDHADVFSAATEEVAASRITDIGASHDVSVVVYTQYKPGSTDHSTESDARALKLQWRLVNALVVMWNTTSPECEAGAGGNGRVQLYADTRFSATRLSELKRQKIFDDLMLPFLRECNEDDALLAALDGIADEMRAPTSTPESSDSPIGSKGACDDDAFKLGGIRWEEPFEWFFQEASLPDEYDSEDVLEVLIRSAENITAGRNDCGLPDRIDATARYAGTTTEPPCAASLADGFNTVGFGKPDDEDRDLLAYVCPYGIRDVIEADIVINSEMPWALSADECRGFGELLEATMTHEFGHAFGLGHVSERQHGELTMSPTSNGPCSPDEISLGLGDILGLEELY
jgi:hypothetical protein